MNEANVTQPYGLNPKDVVSCIYGWKNIGDGKWYIGQTINVYNRKKEHLSYLRRNAHYNPHFQRAWNLYGESQFEFQILEFCAIDMLNIRETSWINYHNSTNKAFGYNIEGGGCKSKIVSEETRKKMSASLKGRKHSEERNRHKSVYMRIALQNRRPMSDEEKIKLSLARRGIKRGPHSEETKQKIRLAHLGKTKGPPSDEHRRKNRESHLGKKHGPMTQEQKDRISKTKKEQFALKKSLLHNLVLFPAQAA